MLGRYNDPAPPKPQRAFIWLLFSPPNESLRAETLLPLLLAVGSFKVTVDCEFVVAGNSLFPLKRLYGFET